MSFAAHLFGRIFIIPILLLFCFTVILPSSVSANTPAPVAPVNTANSDSAVEEDVPMNMHTLVQVLMIEMATASVCQLSGIDLINPDKSCLGINTQTNKIGYAPAGEQQQLGGVVGAATGMIGSLYTPTTSTVEHIRYVANNFGIVKNAHAQTENDGFHALWPVQDLWRLVRNIAYFILILIFVFIGIGVMLRINIDPRTVMTIQNQLPKIVMGILLITFSYAIGAIMIDLMWASTYVGINAITQSHNPEVTGCGGNKKISEVATNNLLETPITYVNQTYNTTCILGSSAGIWNLTTQISGSLGGMLKGIIDNLAGKRSRGCVYFFGVDIASCFSGVIGWLGTVIMFLIILATILFALFRIWYNLLKAYIYTIIYVIMGPLWIVAGLLPQKPLGFGAWWRSLFANLAVFPVTAWLLVFGRVLMDKYNEADKLIGSGAQQYFGLPGIPIANAQPTADQVQNYFVPPLVGNSFAPDFGALLSLGILLLTPNVGEILKNALKAPDLKSSGSVSRGLSVGAAAVGAPATKTWAGLTRRNQQTHQAEAPISRMSDAAKQKVSGVLADKWRLTGRGKLKDWNERVANQRAGYGRMTHSERDDRYSTSAIQDASIRTGKSVATIRKEAAENGMSENYYASALKEAHIEAAEKKQKLNDVLPGQITKWKDKEETDKAEDQRRRLELASGHQPTGSSPTAAPTGTGPKEDHQPEGEHGEDHEQPPTTLNLEGVEKVVISGDVDLSVNSDRVQDKTPAEHIRDITPEDKRDDHHQKLEAFGRESGIGTDWIQQRISSLPPEIKQRFQNFINAYYEKEEPPTEEA